MNIFYDILINTCCKDYARKRQKNSKNITSNDDPTATILFDPIEICLSLRLYHPYIFLPDKPSYPLVSD